MLLIAFSAAACVSNTQKNKLDFQFYGEEGKQIVLRNLEAQSKDMKEKVRVDGNAIAKAKIYEKAERTLSKTKKSNKKYSVLANNLEVAKKNYYGAKSIVYNRNRFCNTLNYSARSIMSYRQFTTMTKNRALVYLGESEIDKALIGYAYTYPMYDNTPESLKAINEFGKSAYKMCKKVG